MGQNTAHYLYN